MSASYLRRLFVFIVEVLDTTFVSVFQDIIASKKISTFIFITQQDQKYPKFLSRNIFQFDCLC